MTQYIIKVAISAALIVAVAEISKRSTFIGALLASLPVISVMGMLWFYLDTKDTEKVARLSMSIFWLALPSLVLFPVMGLTLRAKWNFYASLGTSFVAMLVCYGAMLTVLNKLGVKL
jgi:hypothetical protein